MVTKLVIKMVLMLAIVLGISNYVMYLMTGKTPFSSADIPGFSAPSLSDLKPSIPAGKDTVYKWVDEDGAVHYSSEPPPENTQLQVEKMEVDPNVNVVQAIKVPAEDAEGAAAQQAPQQINPIQSPYSPEGIKKLMDDAKAIQKTLNERYEETEKAYNEN